MDVFWRNGYEGASLAQLTEAMGINSPSLYATFGSKEALYKEAVEQYDAEIGADINASLSADTDVRTAVYETMRITAEYFSDPERPAGCMVLLSALNCTPENASVAQHMCDLRKRSGNILRQRLLRAQAAGEIAATANIEQLTAFIMSVRQGMSIQARDGAGRTALLAIADATLVAFDAMTASAKATAQDLHGD
ncbi:TetR family transcriptional regulator [Silvimonas iriomotensis]|uniref:TetR family transcriptional regulator n=2 Tax=Silvimonas iriomotensis TaxID=449662 RepID=A0ABQ2P7J9_9NEIS|nr:TetR family transcriptional regulator [Silvimonas iriomotensis]